MALGDLKNLSPKSEAQLKTIGIHSLAALRHGGAIDVFIDLKTKFPGSISSSFLYAMSGALENCDWREIASDKGTLLTELESRMDIIQTLDL